MRATHWIAPLAGAGLALALVLFGCRPAEQTAAPPETAPPAPAPEITANAPTPAPEGRLRTVTLNVRGMS